MTSLKGNLLLVAIGLVLIHTVTCQTATAAPTGSTPPADTAIQADVAMTVIALLNETGYSGSVNDANVQEIVKMLMNGTVPTDADLMRLGIIPTHAPVTTPPPYIIPVTNPLDTVISPLQPVTPAPTPTPTLDIAVPVQPSASTNPLPAMPGGFQFPSNIFPGLLPPTTPKPFDPFAQANIGNQLSPNAVAPKPAPVDLLGSLNNFPSSGTSGGMAPPPSGILETQYQQQQQQQRNQGMNPLMMMMFMMPEMAETMMSGENPMLTMMLMQSMQQSQRPRQPATPPMGSPFGPSSGFPSAGPGAGGSFMDQGFGGMPAPGAGSGLMDLSSLTGANTVPNTMGGTGASSNLMPLLNMINQPTGSALPGMPLPGSAPPMDMSSLLSNFGTLPTGGATPTGAASPTDMGLANLISPGTQPTGGSPTLDPFPTMG